MAERQISSLMHRTVAVMALVALAAGGRGCGGEPGKPSPGISYLEQVPSGGNHPGDKRPPLPPINPPPTV